MPCNLLPRPRDRLIIPAPSILRWHRRLIDAALADAGLEAVKIPPRSPRAHHQLT